MHRTPRIQTLGRLAAAVAILISLLLPLGAGPAAAADFEPPAVLPSVPATGSLPGSIVVRWQHFEQGVYDYSVERENPYWRWDNVNAAQRDLFDGGLQPDTEYRYRVCAYFITEDGDVACSEWEPGRTSPPGQSPAANFDPPTVTNLEATHDSITVSWGPTGDYTRILVHLSDDQGNVDQREVTNTPNGSFHFPGMRSGARYRVILKGCSLSLAGSGCGPWSPDVFITTPLPNQASGGPPPGAASFESVNVPGHFIRHRFSLGELTTVSTDLDRADATFIVRPGLSGTQDSVSFESVNYPGHFLRHNFFRIKLHANDGSDLFRQDASFMPSLPGPQGGVNFESVNVPGHFIRHQNFELWLAKNDGSDLFAQDANWRQVPPR